MRRLMIPLLLLALVAVACGGDGDGDVSVGDPVTVLDVNMVEFEFDPADNVVSAGETITLNLANTGSVEHEWVVLKSGTRIEAEADFDESMVEFRAELDPGDSGTFTFTGPEPGNYQVVCVIPGHFTAGMEGRLRTVNDS